MHAWNNTASMKLQVLKTEFGFRKDGVPWFFATGYSSMRSATRWPTRRFAIKIPPKSWNMTRQLRISVYHLISIIKIALVVFKTQQLARIAYWSFTESEREVSGLQEENKPTKIMLILIRQQKGSDKCIQQNAWMRASDFDHDDQ